MRSTTLLGLTVASTLAACHLVAGYDELGFGDSSGSGTGTTVGPSTGGGGTGGVAGGASSTGGTGGTGGVEVPPTPFGEVRDLTILGTAGDERIRDAVYDADGNLYVVGSFDGTLTLADATLTSTGDDVLVVKLDADLAPVWARGYGSVGTDQALALALDPQGRIFVVGEHDDTIDFGQGPLSNAFNGPDCFVVSIATTTGDSEWSQSWGGDGFQGCVDAAFDPVRGLLSVAGRNVGTVQIGPFQHTKAGNEYGNFVAIVDRTGTLDQVAAFDAGPESQRIDRLDLSADGTLHVTGLVEDTIDFLKGIALTRPVGDPASYWARISPTLIGISAGFVAERGEGRALDVAPDGSFVVGGRFQGDGLLGGTTVSSTGGSFDGYVVAYDAAADVSFALRLGDADAQRVEEVLTEDSLRLVFVGGVFRGKIAELGPELVAGAAGIDRAFVGATTGAGVPRFALSTSGTSGAHDLEALARAPDGTLLVAVNAVGAPGATFAVGTTEVELLGGSDALLVRIGGDPGLDR